MDDGYRLPLRRWGDGNNARGVLLALHGFNDYGNAFAEVGPSLARAGILTYAYDQRGFGETTQYGHWAGSDRLIRDLRTVSELLRKRHAGRPFFLLGESMGGAVIMAAATPSRLADGILLVAPAVWARDTMNPVQRFTLWLLSHSFPSLKLSGRGLNIHPSDNLEMLRALGADPLVIKETRVDALWGITNLMDRALAAADRLPSPALVLYGEKDEIIPKEAFCSMVDALSQDRRQPRLVLYANGWHMLTRDLQRERVLADITAWLADTRSRLPSGEDVSLNGPRVTGFCRGTRSSRSRVPPTAAPGDFSSGLARQAEPATTR